MNNFSYDHIIVGAGISGLYTARNILKNHYQNSNQNDSNDGEKQSSISILILEAKQRIGGRLYTSSNNHDLGGTWIWPNHDFRTLELCHDLGIHEFELNDSCYFHNGVIDISNISNFMTKRQKKKNNNGENSVEEKEEEGEEGEEGEDYERVILPDQLRFIGGSEQLIHGIVNELKAFNVTILCNHKVSAIQNGTIVQTVNMNDEIEIVEKKKQKNATTSSSSSLFHAKQTITLAIPPQMILRHVKLFMTDDQPMIPTATKKSTMIIPPSKKGAMEKTPTWMENASKIHLTYPSKIWDDHQLPLNFKNGSYIFDVSNDNQYSTTKEHGEEDEDVEKTCTICIFQVGVLLGVPITKEYIYETYLVPLSQIIGTSRIQSDLIHYEYHDWSLDPFTSTTATDTTSSTSSSSTTTSEIPSSSAFGSPELRKPIQNIFFASTETEKEHGHIEGALKSGERVSNQIMHYLQSL